MIVKLQQALYSTNDQKSTITVLIYNKDRSVIYEDNLPKLIVNKLLGNRPKAYFEAELVNSKINILEEVEAQSW